MSTQSYSMVHADTGQTLWHYPMFDSWPEQMCWVARKDFSPHCKWIGMDSSGYQVCGGYPHDQDSEPMFLMMEYPYVWFCTMYPNAKVALSPPVAP